MSPVVRVGSGGPASRVQTVLPAGNKWLNLLPSPGLEAGPRGVRFTLTEHPSMPAAAPVPTELRNEVGSTALGYSDEDTGAQEG